jgi:hypothetical protein
MSDETTTIYTVERASTHGAVVVVGRFTNQTAADSFAERECRDHHSTDRTEKFDARGENCVGGYRNEMYEWSVIEQSVYHTTDAYREATDDD